MAWAPGVGLLLGVIAAAVLLVVDHPLGAGPLTAAALALATLALLSRGLHLDGLADLADGLGSGQPAPVALEIMRRSDIGPFGTVTLILSLLIQFAALGHAESAGPGRGPAALIAAVVTGRLALTWACRRGVPAARPDGLGALVAGTVRPAIAMTITLAALAASVAAVLISASVSSEPLGLTLPLAVAAGLAAALAVERHAVRRLGGITGDVLGALAEVATTVTLVVAAMGPRALPSRGPGRPGRSAAEAEPLGPACFNGGKTPRQEPLMPPTHGVLNQPPALAGYDVARDPTMREALRREGAGWAEDDISELGRLAGSARVQEQGRQANENPPVLRTYDRFGHRIDEVEFHPAWHELMTVAVRHGLQAAPWRDQRPGAHVARAAGFYVWGAAEAGHCCPISMTYAVVPALRHAPDLAERFEPLLAARDYDYGLRPPDTKRGLLAGMSMTEKQGGSDVRANTTQAIPVKGDGEAGGGSYLLTGHKWFTSAPMGDLFMVLAQAPGGLSCFLLPRVLPDGGRNGMRLQRLKDKLGNRSNASAEVEYEQATAWLVGEEGRGVRTIIEMVNMTRLDCVLGTATGMRAGVTLAAHHAAHRTAFGRRLVDQPLMASVLADLVVESEAATMAAFRLAGATDRAARGDEQETAFRRLALAATKYWVCKRAPAHAAEALECLGGNGYVEESGMPRLYREAPLASIWEGSGNVAALDALRALTRQPETAEAFFAELDQAAGADRRLDQAIIRLRKELSDPSEAQARRLAEAMTLTLQGALLVRFGHPAVADAFASSRLADDSGGPGGWGRAYGTLPSGTDCAAIIDRATPRG
jgi:putative acyl-CoA dehydrogenase